MSKSVVFQQDSAAWQFLVCLTHYENLQWVVFLYFAALEEMDLACGMAWLKQVDSESLAFSGLFFQLNFHLKKPSIL